jgi:hypothetical protein
VQWRAVQHMSRSFAFFFSQPENSAARQSVDWAGYSGSRVGASTPPPSSWDDSCQPLSNLASPRAIAMAPRHQYGAAIPSPQSLLCAHGSLPLLIASWLLHAARIVLLRKQCVRIQ